MGVKDDHCVKAPPLVNSGWHGKPDDEGISNGKPGWNCDPMQMELSGGGMTLWDDEPVKN